MTEDWLTELNRRILGEHGGSGEYAADATGFKNSVRDEAWSRKTGKKGREKKDYTKFHALMDLETRVFQVFESTPGREHEGPYLKALLEPVEHVDLLVADAGYLSRENCTLVAKKGRPLHKAEEERNT